MVAVTNATTNQRRRRGRRIRREGGQGVVLDLALKGVGIWNASVLPTSLPVSLSLWLKPDLLLLSYIRTAHIPHNEYTYTLNIAVGTLQISFPLLVNTGSSDFVRLFLNPPRIKSQRPAPIPSGQRQWSRVLGYYHHRGLPDP